ncbi:pyridoxamine 5'-phosphate oxidase family protein [Gandjariella thermophila]|uniref:Uncharacterized protein n=1 Tax=Gandjariella thermophila TaxID=1931992 RepID=A0A4D4J147_9PSEU|nr:pyridoxamine 5'-phosphate oxidase family protein [Gandjariella thermophila]GDY28528.1 hypothetical protein GTS_01610 [Gandjariella thermophila]
MSSWSDFHTAAPELATAVHHRFAATGLAFRATLRRDGFPQISGIEVEFLGGEVWLGMMPGSRKAADLARDPRLALHAATADPKVSDVRAGTRLITVAAARKPNTTMWFTVTTLAVSAAPG